MPVPTVRIPDPLYHGDYDTKTRISAFDDGAPKTLAVKLGRKTPTSRPPALRLANYLSVAAVPTPPAETNRRAKAMDSIRRMYLNDRYGDCVIAGKYHAIGLWSGNDGPATVVGTDQEVYQQYQSICGPGDNGCVVTDVLDAMKARGLPCNGVEHKIDGYVAVDWANELEVKVALVLFGALTLAIDLPQEWADNPTTWDGPQVNIVGGHDISAIDYNADGVVISTWAGTRLVTWSAFKALNRNTELYAILSPDWYGDDQIAPMGLDAATLKADLAKLGNGTIPEIDPPAPVPPVVPPAPPTPPPVPPTPVPPVSNPSYSFSGTALGIIPLSGTATPAAAHLAGFNPFGLFADALAIVAAVRADPALLAAAQQFLTDLGVTLPAAAARAGWSPNWIQFAQAILQVLIALLQPK